MPSIYIQNSNLPWRANGNYTYIGRHDPFPRYKNNNGYVILHIDGWDILAQENLSYNKIQYIYLYKIQNVERLHFYSWIKISGGETFEFSSSSFSSSDSSSLFDWNDIKPSNLSINYNSPLLTISPSYPSKINIQGLADTELNGVYALNGNDLSNNMPYYINISNGSIIASISVYLPYSLSPSWYLIKKMKIGDEYGSTPIWRPKYMSVNPYTKNPVWISLMDITSGENVPSIEIDAVSSESSSTKSSLSSISTLSSYPSSTSSIILHSSSSYSSRSSQSSRSSLSSHSSMVTNALLWDANDGTAGQTDGSGAWLGANQWWTGSTNSNWIDGRTAIIGNGGVGGAVTIASPIIVNYLLIGSYITTGYTLGTVGQTITLYNGILKEGGIDLSIISPITLAMDQRWSNDSSGSFTVSGAITNNGKLLITDGSTDITISGAISGLGGVTKNGTNKLILTADSGATGVLTINNGTVQFGSGSTTGSIAATSIVNNWLLAYNRTTNLTVSSNISGSGSLIQSGTNALTLSGNNSYGNTSISGGQIIVGSNTGCGTGTIYLTNNALRLKTASFTVPNNIVINTCLGTTGRGLIENFSNGNAVFSGSITINDYPINGGHFGFASGSSGTVTISGPINITNGISPTYRGVTSGGTAILILSGGGNYTGFAIDLSTVRLGATNGMSTNATISMGAIGNAYLDLNGYNQTLVGLTQVANACYIGNGSNTTDSTLTLTGSFTFSGQINNTFTGGNKKVNVVINSSGTVSLTNNNLYTGTTTINNGIFQFITLTATPITIVNGTLLGRSTSGASASVTGTVTVSNSTSAIIRAGTFGNNTMNTGALTFNGPNSRMIVDSTSNTMNKIGIFGSASVQLGGCGIIFNSGITTNGTYDIIATNGSMTGTLPTIITNNTGKNIVLQISGGALQAVVS